MVSDDDRNRRLLARASGLGDHPMHLLDRLALAGVDAHAAALHDLGHALDRIEDHVLTE